MILKTFKKEKKFESGRRRNKMKKLKISKKEENK